MVRRKLMSLLRGEAVTCLVGKLMETERGATERFWNVHALVALRCKALLSEQIFKSTGWLFFSPLRILIWMAGDCYVKSKPIAALFLKLFLCHVFH